MRLKIKVHSNSSQEKILSLGDNEYEIWIKEKPIDGKANSCLEKFLKRKFNRDVKIVSGFTSRIKILEVR